MLLRQEGAGTKHRLWYLCSNNLCRNRQSYCVRRMWSQYLCLRFKCLKLWGLRETCWSSCCPKCVCGRSSSCKTSHTVYPQSSRNTLNSLLFGMTWVKNKRTLQPRRARTDRRLHGRRLHPNHWGTFADSTRWGALADPHCSALASGHWRGDAVLMLCLVAPQPFLGFLGLLASQGPGQGSPRLWDIQLHAVPQMRWDFQPPECFYCCMKNEHKQNRHAKVVELTSV